MGRAHEVRAASMAKTAAMKSAKYAKWGKEIFQAAKTGVPDPEMNQSLKNVIARAKKDQCPANVIARALEKAPFRVPFLCVLAPYGMTLRGALAAQLAFKRSAWP